MVCSFNGIHIQMRLNEQINIITQMNSSIRLSEARYKRVHIIVITYIKFKHKYDIKSQMVVTFGDMRNWMEVCRAIGVLIAFSFLPTHHFYEYA